MKYEKLNKLFSTVLFRFSKHKRNYFGIVVPKHRVAFSIETIERAQSFQNTNPLKKHGCKLIKLRIVVKERCHK